MQAGHTGVWNWEFATDRLSWSEETYAIEGREAGDFKETLESFMQLVHPDDRNRVSDAMVPPCTVRSSFMRLSHHSSGRGDPWVKSLGIVQLDSTDQRALMTGTITDITERRAAEQALLHQERAMRSLADNTPDILTRFDRHLRYVFVNSAIENPAGRGREEFVGRSMRDLGLPEALCQLWESALVSVLKPKNRS